LLRFFSADNRLLHAAESPPQAPERRRAVDARDDRRTDHRDGIAERAIGGLKVTVRECDENLGAQLTAGTALSAKLTKQVAMGEAI
jgi:hypothetical protein